MTEQCKFAVFDIDGTLIRWQLYHAIVDHLAKDGRVPEHAYEKVRKARMDWKSRNHREAFRAYELELISAFEATLPMIPIPEFVTTVEAVFTKHKDQVYTYTRNYIERLRADGYVLFAISASPYEIVELIAAYYVFDDFVGSLYTRIDGRFTNKQNSVVNKKADLLKALIAKHNVTLDGSIGIGDSDSDIAMLELVEQPIAFNPTRKFFSYAHAAGWKIVIERKNMVYELKSVGGIYQLENPKTG